MSENLSDSMRPKQHSDPLCRIALWQPHIAENTGNIARTVVATGSELHLIGPLGFQLSDRRLKRAGLDYWPHLHWANHSSWEIFQNKTTSLSSRRFVLETYGNISFFDIKFQRGDIFIFGNETTGLPIPLAEEIDAPTLYLPQPGPVRSLNLANTAAIVVYEVLRQMILLDEGGNGKLLNRT